MLLTMHKKGYRINDVNMRAASDTEGKKKKCIQSLVGKL
jgi:hypothetical protein